MVEKIANDKKINNKKKSSEEYVKLFIQEYKQNALYDHDIDINWAMIGCHENFEKLFNSMGLPKVMGSKLKALSRVIFEKVENKFKINQRDKFTWFYKYFIILMCTNQSNPEYKNIKEEFINVLIEISTKENDKFDLFNFSLLIAFIAESFVIFSLTLLTPNSIIKNYKYGFTNVNLGKYIDEEKIVFNTIDKRFKPMIVKTESINSNTNSDYSNSVSIKNHYDAVEDVIEKQSKELRKDFPDWHLFRTMFSYCKKILSTFNGKLGEMFSKNFKRHIDHYTIYLHIEDKDFLGNNTTVKENESNSQSITSNSISCSGSSVLSVGEKEKDFREDLLKLEFSKDDIEKGKENLLNLDFVDSTLNEIVNFSNEKILSDGSINSSYCSESSSTILTEPIRGRLSKLISNTKDSYKSVKTRRLSSKGTSPIQSPGVRTPQLHSRTNSLSSGKETNAKNPNNDYLRRLVN